MRSSSAKNPGRRPLEMAPSQGRGGEVVVSWLMCPDGGEFTCPASRLHWRRVLSCQSRTPHAESRIHRRRRPSRPRSHAHYTTPEGRRNVGVCEIDPECLRWATEASPFGRIYDDHWEMLEREDLDIVYCVMHERCAGCSLVTRHVGGGRSYRTAERPRRVPQPFPPSDFGCGRGESPGGRGCALPTGVDAWDHTKAEPTRRPG